MEWRSYTRGRDFRCSRSIEFRVEIRGEVEMLENRFRGYRRDVEVRCYRNGEVKVKWRG